MDEAINKSTLSDADPFTVTVYAVDYAGATNKTSTFTLNVDRTVPSITMEKTDSTEESLTVKVTTDADAGACTTNQGTITGTGATQTITASNLDSETTYAFTVRCTDEAGNSKEVTSSFTTDATTGGQSGGGSGGGGSSGGSSSGSSSSAGAGAGESAGAGAGSGGAGSAGTAGEETRTGETAGEQGETPGQEVTGGSRADEQELTGTEEAPGGSSALVWTIVALVVVVGAGAYLAMRKRE